MIRKITITASALILLFFCSCTIEPSQITEVAQSAKIYPDYSDITFPSNISSISFKVEESGQSYKLEVRSDGETIYSTSSEEGEFTIPIKRWRKLAENSQFEMVITATSGDSAKQYAPIINYFSQSEIDSYLSYRLIPPGYEIWDRMGIYQRDLTSFKEILILDSDRAQLGCLNCHTYGSHTTENTMVHYRGIDGGTIISHNGEVKKVNFNSSKKLIAEGTYPVWHPSNNYIAYSVNDVQIKFHLNGKNPVEVPDTKSDIILYDIAKNEVIVDDLICNTAMLETFPEWSDDGKTLYFTAADKGSNDVPLDSIKYKLYSVDFDINTCRFSNKKLLFDPTPLGLTVSNAKSTKCGKYIVATVAQYGNFMIWHQEAELVIIDLESGEYRFLDEINSPMADSYHSFSSSGEWMVFSSRRGDGLYTRPYITKFDSEKGSFTKPFLLPQKSVEYYDNLFFSYNIPNFSKDKFTMQRKFMNKTRESGSLKAKIVSKR